jgi:hypothetical protein
MADTAGAPPPTDVDALKTTAREQLEAATEQQNGDQLTNGENGAEKSAVMNGNGGDNHGQSEDKDEEEEEEEEEVKNGGDERSETTAQNGHGDSDKKAEKEAEDAKVKEEVVKEELNDIKDEEISSYSKVRYRHRHQCQFSI